MFDIKDALDSDIEKASKAVGWITALESASGYVKQGKCQLGDTSSGFCCLGFGAMCFDVPHKPTDDYSVKFAKEVGLLSSIGGPKLGGGFLSLTYLNDKFDRSFKQISSVLRRHPEVYFEKPVADVIRWMLEND